MSLHHHHLRHYVRRFGLEWTCFVSVGTANNLIMRTAGGEAFDLPLTILEAAVFGWFALRLMQAESTFLTHGGWRVRPLEARWLRRCRWLMFFSALLPVMMLRIWTMHDMVDLSGGAWLGELLRDWMPWLVILTGSAGLLGALGEGIAATGGRKWTGILCGAAAAACLITAGACLAGNSLDQAVSGSSGSTVPRGVLPFIPSGERLIAITPRWSGGDAPKDQSLRILMRVPLKQGATASLPGLKAEVTVCQPAGMRLKWGLVIRGLTWKLKQSGMEPVVVVRYPGGIWAQQMRGTFATERLRLAMLNVGRMDATGDALSPMSEPWNRRSWSELLQGAELVLFVPDKDGPAPPPPDHDPVTNDGTDEAALDLPALANQPTAEQLLAAAHAAVDLLHGRDFHKDSRQAMELLTKAGPAIIEPLLRSGPFSQRAWSALEPFFVRHATEAHKAPMLRLLETDGRIGSVMVQKGWTAEALPLLRKHLVEGLPLTFAGVKALADLKDESLAPALRRRFLFADPIWKPLDDAVRLGESLRDHPGINWPELARQKWHRQGSPVWAEQCARAGDKAILRHMAARWLGASTPPDKPTIQDWIARESWDGEATEFPAWLRANFDRLQWDPEGKRWRIP